MNATIKIIHSRQKTVQCVCGSQHFILINNNPLATYKCVNCDEEFAVKCIAKEQGEPCRFNNSGYCSSQQPYECLK